MSTPRPNLRGVIRRAKLTELAEAINSLLDHGLLQGLGDDDHTQYLLANGSRALSANWDAGSWQIRAETFQSDVVTGTAPLTVASTTKVTNLNADLLDDQTGSYYLDSANFTGTNWTDLTDGGTTTLHTHTSGVASSVTVANEATDTTCFPVFVTAATGNLDPKSNTGLTYDSSTNNLAATTFTGALSGNATTATSATSATNATNIGVTDAAGDTSTWVLLAGTQTGTQGALTDGGLTYNANTNALTATTFIGALTGNADTATSATSATSATNATNIGVTDAASDTSTWVLLAGSQTGTQGALTDAGISYNASTNVLTTDVAFTQSGTGAAARTLDTKAKEIEVSVLDYGTTRADWQEAYDYVNTQGGGTVVWPARSSNYTFGAVDTGITVYENTHTVIERGATLDMTGMNVSAKLFIAEGTETAEASSKNLNSSASEGDTSITLVAGGVAALGVTANDWIRIYSDKIYATQDSAYQGEFVQVKSISTDTMTLWTPLQDGYATGDTARVRKCTFIRGVRFSGGGRIIGTRTDTDNHNAIWLSLCNEPSVADLTFYQLTGSGVTFDDSLRPQAHKLHFEDFWATSRGYGVFPRNCCQDGVFTSLSANRVRHLFTTSTGTTRAGVTGRGIPRRHLFDGWVTINSATASGGSGGDSVDTHAAAEDIHLVNGISFGASNQGVNFEARSGSIKNVFVYNSADNGIGIQNEADYASGSMVVDNVHVFNAGGAGIDVDPGGISDTFTVTIASPAVFTYATGTSDVWTNDREIYFTTTGALPTGLSTLTSYYIKNVNTTANTFEVAATPGGASINTSGGQSGTHTVQNARKSWTHLQISNVSSHDCANIGIAVEGDRVQKIKNATFSNWVVKNAGSTSSSAYIDDVDDFTLNGVTISGAGAVGAMQLRLSDVRYGRVSNVVSDHVASATGAVVRVQATAGAGSATDISIDGVYVKSGSYTSLRGVLIDNDANNVHIGDACDLSNAAVSSGTEITWGSGTGHTSGTLGPTSSTDNTLPRFDGTTGRVIQSSGVTVSDVDDMSGVNDLDLDGRIGVGTAAVTTTGVNIAAATSGGGTQYGIQIEPSMNSATTNSYGAYVNYTATNATITSAFGVRIADPTRGGTTTIANQYGLYVNDLTAGSTITAGLRSEVASAATKWNVYAAGTAQNAFQGNVRIGSTTAPSATLDVTGTVAASGQITSTVSTGSAPLVIASTTKVTNLNADLLDDQTGSYYLDGANFTGTNWTDLTDGGDTTLHQHSAVTVANEAADTTCFVNFTTGATGNLQPKTNAGLTYNSATNNLSATTFTGALSGNADTVTVANEATDTSCFLLFSTAASGSLAPKTNANLTLNSSTGVVTFASSVLTTTDINGGTIDGVTIGGVAAGAITATTLTASSTVNLTGTVATIGTTNPLSLGNSRWAIGSTASASGTAFMVASSAWSANATQVGIRGINVFSAPAAASLMGMRCDDYIADSGGDLTYTNYYNFYAGDLTLNRGTDTLTNQYGFRCENLTKGGTLIAGFSASVTSGTGKWGFYSVGNANNAFAGNVRIGSVVAPTVALDVTGAALISSTLGVTGTLTLSGAAANLELGSNYISYDGTDAGLQVNSNNIFQITTALGIGISPSGAYRLRVDLSGFTTGTSNLAIAADGAFPSGATGSGYCFYANPSTAAASFTMSSLYMFRGNFGTKGAGSAITNAYGLYLDDFADTGSTATYSVRTIQSAGSGTNWNHYCTGTANNAFQGNTRIGGTAAPTVACDVTGAVAATTHIRSSGATSGVGYATGAGGTVTQLTSKSTSVTLSKVCGTITMHNAALAGDTSVSFTLTNTAIEATDMVLVQHDNTGTLGAYNCIATPAAGSASITVRNVTTGSLSEAIVLRFIVVKAVTS